MMEQNEYVQNVSCIDCDGILFGQTVGQIAVQIDKQ